MVDRSLNWKEVMLYQGKAKRKDVHFASLTLNEFQRGHFYKH
jgi:hypothetical protein